MAKCHLSVNIIILVLPLSLNLSYKEWWQMCLWGYQQFYTDISQLVARFTIESPLPEGMYSVYMNKLFQGSGQQILGMVINYHFITQSLLLFLFLLSSSSWIMNIARWWSCAALIIFKGVQVLVGVEKSFCCAIAKQHRVTHHSYGKNTLLSPKKQLSKMFK